MNSPGRTKKNHLTQDAIAKARYEGADNARYVLWDDNPKGLGLRIYPSGRKCFVVLYRDVGGAKRLASIGDFGVFTLDQARDQARDMLRQAETGADALAVRKVNRAAPTFGELAAEYLKRHAATKKTGDADARRLEFHVLPAWKNRKAGDISHQDVAALIHKVGTTRAKPKAKDGKAGARKAKARPAAAGKRTGRPYEANRLLALLAVMFNKAHSYGMLPAGHPNPCAGVDRFREEKRERWVSSAELPSLAKAIDAEGDPYARAALWLYLLTGCRKGELLGAKWCDIDAERKALRLPKTKAGRSHDIPLSAPAMAIIEALPKQDGNPYVFPGRKASDTDNPEPRHLESIRGPWDRVRIAAGVADVRLHDLRRTVGSWLAQSGNSLHLIGRVLNHSNTATTAVYARFAQDHVRDALDAHATKILGAAGKLPSADIVDIATARK